MSAPAATVVETLTDEAFVRAFLADLGADVREVVARPGRTTARYTVPTQGIPEVFARFVGDRVELTDVRTWTVDGDTATGTVLVTASVFGRDVRLEGDRRIAGGTLTTTGRSHVDAPFVGRKAEGGVDELAVLVMQKEAARLG
ncbi:DUF2505 domain-containing protein [Klenkia sp. PcliD-1-E]|uniref:DUF2505 domain-containing protein n=1 Tax=Klenkia sp. PcliD-1-E TaxID=2954492 RepID=UPI00209858C1|nr:DUF2505 domain-containing protein [Klenkia sp. PcliD-1-E]MCO7221505.1 DUF2505 domain-containing protein [Klenkia sp. PcliD-1-E]